MMGWCECGNPISFDLDLEVVLCPTLLTKDSPNPATRISLDPRIESGRGRAEPAIVVEF